MSKTLVSLPQITPPPTLASNAALLTNIARLAALNPKELLALSVYFRAKELANDTSAPLTNYDPDVAVKLTALQQDAKAMFGSIPTGDLHRAAVAVDWANSKAVYAALSSDVDALGALQGVATLRTLSEDELKRIAAYLRLELGQ